MVTEMLTNKVREKVKLGMDEGAIKNNLISEGWPLVDIEEALGIEMKGMIPVKIPQKKQGGVGQYIGMTILGLLIALGGGIGMMKLMHKDLPFALPDISKIIEKYRTGSTLIDQVPETPVATASPTLSEDIMPLVQQTSLLADTSYVDEKGGYKITPPKNWEVDSSGKLGAPVFFFGPDASASGKFVYKANISVLIGPAKNNTVEGYVNYYLESISKKFDSFSVIEKRKITVSGRGVVILRDTFVSQGESFTGMHLILVSNDFVYIVTGTALSSDYNNIKQELEQSVYSFNVL
jgi:hypothetical protein